MRDLRVFWTASLFFHRFYVYHNFSSHDRFVSEVSPLRVCKYICYVFMYVYVYLDIRSGLSISRFKGGGEATASIRPHTCHTNVA